MVKLNFFVCRKLSSREAYFRVYVSVKSCEFFLCFLAIIFPGSIVLTSQWLLCIHCFMSLMSFTGFYTEDEPFFQMISWLDVVF